MSRMTNTSTLYTAQQNVTTSGTPVQLTAQSVPQGAVAMVKAKSGNAGTITVGFSSATALNTGTSHFKLAANQAVSVQVNNLNAVWIDATTNGEGVEIIVEDNA